MPHDALNARGERVDASDIPAALWERMKPHPGTTHFTMSCCASVAVMKTSVNGRQFFAHMHGECSTAPETAWHTEEKDVVVDAFATLGVVCAAEVPGAPGVHAGRRTPRSSSRGAALSSNCSVHISGQQLLDGSVILLNDDRVDLKLN